MHVTSEPRGFHPLRAIVRRARRHTASHTARRAARRRLAVAVAVPLAGATLLALPTAPAGAAAPTTWYVAQGGSDSHDCRTATPAEVCATISHALSLAASGDTIDVIGTVAGGVTVPDGMTIAITGIHAPSTLPALAASNPVVYGTSPDDDYVFYLRSGSLTLTDLAIEGGTLGGILNQGTLRVVGSTIKGNSDTEHVDPGFPNIGRGGGLSNEGAATVIDSTITGNTALVGGGIANLAGTDGDTGPFVGRLAVIDSTIAGNTATDPGSGGGISEDPGATMWVGASIIANNNGDDCSLSTTSDAIDYGYNLTDGQNSLCRFNSPSDVSANPQLGPLAYNGGLTATLWPASNSPAAKAIPDPATVGAVPACGPGVTDQAGDSRPEFGAAKCTIGAIEAFTPIVVDPPPHLTPGTPSITGTPKVGKLVSANPGSWSPAPTFTYQWLRNGTAITGATAATYTPVAADAGAKLSVQVTGNALFRSLTVTSAAKTVAKGTLTTTIPRITGTVKVGKTLTAVPGTWTAGTSFKYQWRAAGKNIAGKTAKTLKLASAQRGKKITVKVTGTKPGYTTTSRTSKPTRNVRPA